MTTVKEDGEVITPGDPAAGVKRVTTAVTELLRRTAFRQRRKRSTAPPSDEVQEPGNVAQGRCAASSPGATRKSGGSGAPGAATRKQQDETGRKHAASKTDPTADNPKTVWRG